MTDTLISAIQSFTLQARADLEREAHEQLEGLYGWLPDGSFAPESRYPALTLAEAKENRARLEQYARDEAEAGFDAVNDGIMPCEAGHTQDLAARSLACLDLMQGKDAAREAIKAALGEGDPTDALRGLLDRFIGQPAQSFWRYLHQMLRAFSDHGYTPKIDDCVLLNAAPLHEVLPFWPDTRTAWAELAAGKYDWAHQAMAYWPDRVKAACQTNKSFAIAHGLAVPEEEDSLAKAQRRRGRKKS